MAGRQEHRDRRRRILATGFACLLLALASGCGRSDGAPDAPSGRGSVGAPGGITDEGFVSHVAALTIAVEEGLSGEAVGRRIGELGAPEYPRADVEAFAARLREDPARWVRLARLIEDRVNALRAGARAPADGAAPASSEAASRPSR